VAVHRSRGLNPFERALYAGCDRPALGADVRPVDRPADARASWAGLRPQCARPASTPSRAEAGFDRALAALEAPQPDPRTHRRGRERWRSPCCCRAMPVTVPTFSVRRFAAPWVGPDPRPDDSRAGPGRSGAGRARRVRCGSSSTQPRAGAAPGDRGKTWDSARPGPGPGLPADTTSSRAWSPTDIKPAAPLRGASCRLIESGADIVGIIPCWSSARPPPTFSGSEHRRSTLSRSRGSRASTTRSHTPPSSTGEAQVRAVGRYKDLPLHEDDCLFARMLAAVRARPTWPSPGVLPGGGGAYPGGVSGAAAFGDRAQQRLHAGITPRGAGAQPRVRGATAWCPTAAAAATVAHRPYGRARSAPPRKQAALPPRRVEPVRRAPLDWPARAARRASRARPVA
jgi:hypothetical protein